MGLVGDAVHGLLHVAQTLAARDVGVGVRLSLHLLLGCGPHLYYGSSDGDGLSNSGHRLPSHRALPRVSQQLLAETVGTARSRVNFFMNKFRKLGFIDYDGALKINNSLLTVVLRD
jgi:CRP-like cAMP-binding protein